MPGTHPINVFVSSTSKDLEPYREEARDVILSLGWHPIMMEYFGAMSEATVTACQQKVAESDLLLMVLGLRRGWVPTPEQGGHDEQSITALELEIAEQKGIPVLVLMGDADTWPYGLVEKDAAAQQWIERFRNTINHPAAFFSYEGEKRPLEGFAGKVRQALLNHKEKLYPRMDSPELDKVRVGLHQGTVIPFLGNGIYGDDGPLSASAVARALATEAKLDASLHLPLATAAEYLYCYLGNRTAFLRILAKILAEHSERCAALPVYDLMAAAPKNKLIISATHDLLLETLLEQQGLPHAVVTHVMSTADGEHDGKLVVLPGASSDVKVVPADQVEMLSEGPVIYKVLGSPLLHARIARALGYDEHEVDTTVITESDHLELLSRFGQQTEQVPTAFSRPFRSSSLLFLGYALDVWQYRLVMEGFHHHLLLLQLRQRRRESPAIYAIRKPHTELEQIFWTRLGAELIGYEPNELARSLLDNKANNSQAVSAKVGS